MAVVTDHPRAGGERSCAWLPGPWSAGSSPRGRGTRAPGLGRAALQRIIPARAGNAGRSRVRACPSPDHPRAGGERRSGGWLMVFADGSSPRGRGTPGAARPRRALRRIIPARAGNAYMEIAWIRSSADHPRAGGERAHLRNGRLLPSGSSPRGRGTLHSPGPGLSRRRIIPARAGNAWAGAPACRRSPDHPRAGGERTRRRRSRAGRGGSSPRGRGTPRAQRHRPPTRRIIPARAGNARAPGTFNSALFGSSPRGRGNASRPPATTASTSDHPRAGGERELRIQRKRLAFGSSPRGRGNASSAGISGSGTPDHPRAGGERDLQPASFRGAPGSSPRGRGTLDLPVRERLVGRIIPARAGNASSPATPSSCSPDHPRAGGERTPADSAEYTIDGSSPRGRGTHVDQAAMRVAPRIIPARAGNAPCLAAGIPQWTDHPRAGGERRLFCTGCVSIFGSSPRGRGTLLRQPHDLPMVSQMSKSYRQSPELWLSARTRC